MAEKMTLDEAIQHCEEVAKGKCGACGAEHGQLAEWLKELQRLRETGKNVGNRGMEQESER